MRSLFFVVVFALAGTAAGQSVSLIAEETIKVSYVATKIDSGKKKDTWKIEATAETPAEPVYFAKASAAATNPSVAALTDLINTSNNRYVKISVTNHAGVFAAADHFFTAEKANRVGAPHVTMYEVLPGFHTESFTVEVRAGARPAVQAVLLADLQPALNFPFVRADPDVLFSGSSPASRMFLLYKDTDTLLVRRDHVLTFLDRRHRPAEATYTNEQFLVHTAAGDSMTTTLRYLDWNDRAVVLRIRGGELETSANGTFTDARPAKTVALKDSDGSLRILKLEPVKKNVFVFNVPTPAAALPTSDNGRYSLYIAGGLALRDNSTGQPVWSIMTVGAAPRGLLVAIDNGVVTGNLLSYTTGADGTSEKGAFLLVGDDGNLLIFLANGFAVWQSGSGTK